MSRETQCILALFSGAGWMSFGIGGAFASVSDIAPLWFYLATMAAGGIALVIGGRLMQALRDKARRPE